MGNFEHKVQRETRMVSFYGSLKLLCFNLIKHSQIHIQHHPLTANDMNFTLDVLNINFRIHWQIVRNMR